MLYNIYNISIDRIILILDHGKHELVIKWGWLPKRIINNHVKQLQKDFAEMFNASDVSSHLKNAAMQMKLRNLTYNLLPIIYLGLSKSDSDVCKEIYKEIFFSEYTGRECLQYILDKQQQLADKIRPDKPTEQTEEKNTSLSELITSIEFFIDRNIDREMKVIHFKDIYEQAKKQSNG